MSERLDLSGVAGDDLAFTFTLTRNGQALDLDGFQVTILLKPGTSFPDSAGTSYTTGTGVVITDAPAGLVLWEVPAAATAISAPGSLWYRLEITGPSDDTATAMFGALALTAA